MTADGEPLQKEDNTAIERVLCEGLRMEGEVFDVLILGAGLAGLGAARELRKSGRSVCILEAQSQPGGRVRTVKMIPKDDQQNSTIIAEAGAQWIHGKENSLYNVAAENNLISSELGEEACGRFIREDGKVFDEYLVKRVDFKVGQILEECENFVTSPLEKDVSIGEYLKEKFIEFLDENPDIDREEGLQLLDWHIRFQIIDNSCLDLKEVGANEWGRYSFNGESCQAHINVQRGFEKVLDVIVRDVGLERIFCNHEVEKIKWESSKPSVECKNGKSFSGKFLIVTIPIGVLKEEHGIFDPELPKDIRSAISHMGYGTINKIYLRFNRPFWESDFKGVQFIWSKEVGSDWTRWMTGFDVINGDTLLGWVGGSGAIEMESKTDEQIILDCLRVLEHTLAKNIPQPSNYYCTRWHSNPFIRGSYCFNGLMDENSPQTPLNKPISKNVYFAGEACHPNYFSTAHGAFESGIDQAKEILSISSSTL